MDAPHLHDEIIAILGEGTDHHKKGDPVPARDGKHWKNDIWMIETPISEQEDISEHLRWLVGYIEPHEEQIKSWISRGARADFYFSYCCDHDHCGFGLPPDLLDVFPRLGLRLAVSIMT
jgi:hypothetical protein